MEKYITLDIRCCIVDNKKVSKRGNKQVTIVRGMTSPMDDRKKLLKEMKHIKTGQNKANTELPDTVGGADGEQAISEMFRESYETLFNSAPSGQEMEEMKTLLNNLIGLSSKQEVEKVTGAIVKEAVAKLKPRKTDVSGDMSLML